MPSFFYGLRVSNSTGFQGKQAAPISRKMSCSFLCQKPDEDHDNLETIPLSSLHGPPLTNSEHQEVRPHPSFKSCLESRPFLVWEGVSSLVWLRAGRSDWNALLPVQNNSKTTILGTCCIGRGSYVGRSHQSLGRSTCKIQECFSRSVQRASGSKYWV